MFPFSRLDKVVERPHKIRLIENPVTLGEKIRNRRLSLEITQEETGRGIGAARDAIVDWENNKTNPTIEFYPKIIEFLGYFPFEIDTSFIGGRVKKYRFLHGLSQADFGNLIGIGGSTIMRLEHQIGTPCRRTVRLINKILDSEIKIKGLPSHQRTPPGKATAECC